MPMRFFQRVLCYIYSGTSASLRRAAVAPFLLLGETCSQLLGKDNDDKSATGGCVAS